MSVAHCLHTALQKYWTDPDAVWDVDLGGPGVARNHGGKPGCPTVWGTFRGTYLGMHKRIACRQTQHTQRYSHGGSGDAASVYRRDWDTILEITLPATASRNYCNRCVGAADAYTTQRTSSWEAARTMNFVRQIQQLVSPKPPELSSFQKRKLLHEFVTFYGLYIMRIGSSVALSTQCMNCLKRDADIFCSNMSNHVLCPIFRFL